VRKSKANPEGLPFLEFVSQEEQRLRFEEPDLNPKEFGDVLAKRIELLIEAKEIDSI